MSHSSDDTMKGASMFATARKFAGHVLPHVIRPLRVLWNEIVGFLFFVMAVMFAVGSRRLVGEHDGSLESTLKIGVMGLFILMMLGFGVSSFRRARKISRW
jgi:hypothetical protein